VMDSIADLVDEEREQFKLRKVEKLLNAAIAKAPNDSATYQLNADYQAMLARYHKRKEELAAIAIVKTEFAAQSSAMEATAA